MQILELGAADRSKSVLAVFKLPESGTGPVTVIPRGVDSGRTYLDNSATQAVISGWELTGRRITTDPLSVMTSELILPEAIDN